MSKSISSIKVQRNIVETGPDFYENYNPHSAVQTQDIIGKHVYEFKRQGSEEVPEIFFLLINYFESQPELYKTEGLFRVCGAIDAIEELQVHLTLGNYYYLT